jgi:hypothetical protein
MREFITQDGNRIVTPDHEPTVVAEPMNSHVGIDYHCACHKRMGNDFWFLPAGQCLRDDKTCDAKVPL